MQIWNKMIIFDAIQTKCLAFGDRIIKLNDYLLAQAVAAHENYKKLKISQKGKRLRLMAKKGLDAYEKNGLRDY